MAMYFSVISRTMNGFEFTSPTAMPRNLSISDHYRSLTKIGGVVSVVYRQTETDALSAARKRVRNITEEKTEV